MYMAFLRSTFHARTARKQCACELRLPYIQERWLARVKIDPKIYCRDILVDVPERVRPGASSSISVMWTR